MMIRWWDAVLRTLGLMRISQQPLKKLTIRQGDVGPRYIVIELRNGVRVSGYLDTRFGVVQAGHNPLIGGTW